ncbi:MAG: pyridoxal phosphate-dependent aminotransferase [Clostridiales Family XIII bacterium]|nr:pyridoxal phosphate-dependent aminotransferase [Clostridiales Family XIII bacterium]
MDSSIFDNIIERRGTGSLKYDCAASRGFPDGILPLWVADMDFRVADPIAAALRAAAGHGIFGYTVPDDAYYGALRSWWCERFGYHFEPRSVVITPGVVFSLAQAVRAFTEPGDGVLIQRPVYYPFSEVIECNRRKIVNSPLALGDDGRYGIDFEDFERKLAEERPKLFIMSSPHNPVGRVWERWELERMGDLCIAYGCLVVSDEVHADFTYGENRHTVFATVKDAFRENSIVCTSPSKTFNLAGLQVSNIVIEDNALRRRYKSEIEMSGYSQPNTMGVAACRAAYEEGGPWLDGLLEYLAGNLDLLGSYFPVVGAARGADSVCGNQQAEAGSHVPQARAGSGVRLVPVEGTYLPWLDFRGTDIAHSRVDDLMVNEAGVWLDSGTMFGPEGEGFQRINIACPRSILRKAAESISAAVENHISE